MNTPRKTRFVMAEKTNNLYSARLRNVRRRLFQDDGDNDEQQKHKDIENRFSEERRIQLEQSMEKWNFDFVRGEPRPGRYEWVKLDEQGNEISESKETNGRISAEEASENNVEQIDG
ncbi:uncharacterized protein LOC112454469 isoform X2 [Temnothorax curvispinosus]|uniref:Uncharacterized protein LOC112454469 isoform X2 n=1 Tax=Temnothorax curvispinosus TaxID=300111 RepID=A0A6J1PQQ3_9HYME|nr:uncharacterized protein LOC112454469 isoform X2 [Temnothorax curvispinosus]